MKLYNQQMAITTYKSEFLKFMEVFKFIFKKKNIAVLVIYQLTKYEV